MTQAEVADAAGIDRSLYVNFEGGGRDLTRTYAERLAPILGDAVYQLVTPEKAKTRAATLAELREVNQQALQNQRAILRHLQTLAEGQTKLAGLADDVRRLVDALETPSQQQSSGRRRGTQRS